MRARTRIERPAPGALASERAAPRLLSRSSAADAAPRIEPRELWIAAHLPQIALEALAAGSIEEPSDGTQRSRGTPEPLVVAELQDRAQRVVALNDAAASAGVRAGMSLGAALALVPQLSIQSRDPHRERLLLERLGRLALDFTSRVSLAPPDELLLEVKGSLSLFAGLPKLGRSLLAAFRTAGVQPRLALAPTPLAALAGARFAAMCGARPGGSLKVTDESRLVGALAPLPLEVLRWPPQVIGRLAKVGVRTIGEALRLPRAGFARRFGVETLAALDRLTGRAVDPRRSFQAPERFRMRRGCTYELEHHEAILAALAPLLRTLGGFLEARQCGIAELECRLWHRHAPVTCCALRLAAPAADVERLQALLGERLAAITLPESVRSLELRSGRLVPRALRAESLWQPGEHGGLGEGTASVDLIELLRARLGREAVHGLGIHFTHRPEAASRRVEPEPGTSAARMMGSARATGSSAAAAQMPWPAFRRPLWLLRMPEPLSEIDGLPRWHGPLRLTSEPERIETGWWEGQDAARDYYQAVDIRGVRVWIYRERAKPHRWFLHGVFG
jgi:protein ImuB